MQALVLWTRVGGKGVFSMLAAIPVFEACVGVISTVHHTATAIVSPGTGKFSIFECRGMLLLHFKWINNKSRPLDFLIVMKCTIEPQTYCLGIIEGRMIHRKARKLLM